MWCSHFRLRSLLNQKLCCDGRTFIYLSISRSLSPPGKCIQVSGILFIQGVWLMRNRLLVLFCYISWELWLVGRRSTISLCCRLLVNLGSPKIQYLQRCQPAVLHILGHLDLKLESRPTERSKVVQFKGLAAFLNSGTSVWAFGFRAKGNISAFRFNPPCPPDVTLIIKRIWALKSWL